MNNILEWLEIAEDVRQQKKVKHLLKDIIAIVFFAKLANANEWIAIYLNVITVLPARFSETVECSNVLEDWGQD